MATTRKKVNRARGQTSRRARGQTGGGNLGTTRGKHCAPSRGKHPYSCYTTTELQRFAKDMGVLPSRSTLRRNKAALWNAIDSAMQSKCTTEYCWQSYMRMRKTDGQEARRSSSSVGGGRAHKTRSPHSGVADSSGEAFRPAIPSSWEAKPNMWLNTNDIRLVMKQYESASPEFLFIGPVPIDFQSPSGNSCISPDLCVIDLHGWWKEGVRSVGIVFNMDPHDLSGSHWVAAYCDLAAAAAYYYDSYGIKPPQEINALLDQFAEQGKALFGTPMKIEINDTRHQFKNTECGVYAMYFITSMLEGKPFRDFIHDGLNDGQMQRFRRYFYHSF